MDQTALILKQKKTKMGRKKREIFIFKNYFFKKVRAATLYSSQMSRPIKGANFDFGRKFYVRKIICVYKKSELQLVCIYLNSIYLSIIYLFIDQSIKVG